MTDSLVLGSSDLPVKNCTTLTRWFLNLRGARVSERDDSFQRHVGMASKLVGTQKKQGKYTVEQVERAVLAFHREKGRWPDHLGMLTYFGPDGSTWLEYANRVPEMPSVNEPWLLKRWLDEWKHEIPTKTQEKIRRRLGNAIRSNTHGLRAGATSGLEAATQQ